MRGVSNKPNYRSVVPDRGVMIVVGSEQGCSTENVKY